MEELVSDVLVYARPAAPKKEPVDIRRVVENALALVERLIADKNIQVQTDFNRAAPLVNVDAAMLEQAFLNIYRNAIDAMEMNGILQIVTRRSKSDETKIEIIIEDNGCGIDPEDLYHIFNPFFTKKKYGTGLGMTQVKKFIDLHAGNIDITSNKGKGTQVTVTIPIIQEG